MVTSKGRIRKGVPALGYPQVQLKGRGDGTFETGKIHRMVGLAFIPNPDNLPEVNHKFGDKDDCRAWMLEWSTASDNMIHAYRVLGKKNNLEKQKGETHYNTKYKNGDILKMRELHLTGEYTYQQLADMFKDKRNNISRIIRKERWAHI